VTRLGILISEMPHPPPLMPQFSDEHMPSGLSEEKAYNLVLQASMRPPSPPLPSWAPTTAPPPPAAAPAFASPVPNWPWAIPEGVDLTPVPSEGEAFDRARVLIGHGLLYFHFFVFSSMQIIL
jgi:hypothetical protein